MVHIEELNLNTNILSLGSLLGTTGHQSLIDNINQRCGGGSFFGSMNDPFRDGFQTFMNTVITPIQEAGRILINTTNQLFHKDEYRVIDSEEELKKGIPPCMQLSILYFPPIRKMLDEERIYGFGIDPNTLDDEDVYGRILNNGKVEFDADSLPEDGTITFEWNETTDDPVLSDHEQMCLELTRQYAEEFLLNDDTKHFDFTDYPQLHC